MTEQLQKKVDFAIKLIQSASKKASESGQPLEVCYSGGKDSDVILELTKMADVPYRAIYKDTTIDPPYTKQHCIENGVEIHRPKHTFFELVRKRGFPTRRARFCCSELKEYKILDYAILGIRRCESVKRAARYKEPEMCRVYNKKEKTRQYFPILEWTDNDVATFVKEHNIQCHPLYYSDSTTPPPKKFRVNQRLGCICCPLQGDNGLSDFKKYPNMVKAWCDSGQQWLDSHPNAKSNRNFSDVYELFVHNVFYNSYEDFKNVVTDNLFGKGLNCKTFLENYFNIKF